MSSCIVLTNNEGLKCDKCGKSFKNSNKLNRHKNDFHSNEEKRKSMSSSRYKVTGIAAAIAIAVVAGVFFSGNQPSSVNTLQGVECDPLEGTTYHIHAHLDVFVDGKSVTVPAGIGIKPNECLYWLHTHDTSGVIHIESPQQKTFVLGQFVQVWDITPGISQSFENTVRDAKNIHVFVNGTEIKDDYKNIPLNAHDEIVIVSGVTPPQIPSSYEFGGL